ncbi:hypothetical protein [Aestuariicoccus sp. MJ-SS9]|uniref:hypothetical protein n=1 Tax=Aestuariicoccus sp. MJ-SS9 TaxID=3079855 RepID=UPI002907CB02|nr:hypothetical protein [Aestuariicoccus sp. MJ-SS9]MDU8913471.1 hypothetical protein [Aestuariicoccus sp. MJ-SS9]
MFLRGVIAAAACAAILQGCTTPGASRDGASAQEIAAAAYRHPGPPRLTLFTMVNNRSGSGAHTSLMINGSQRVIFDPAGSLRLRSIPERHDVLYGVTPVVADFYARAHARETYHVVIQEIEVSAAVAERALKLAQANGPVAQAQCAVSTAGLLKQLPGFEAIDPTWFPTKLADQFGALPGVTTERLYENDDDDKRLAVREFERRRQAE